MLCREIIAFYSKNFPDPIYTHWQQNGNLLWNLAMRNYILKSQTAWYLVTFVKACKIDYVNLLYQTPPTLLIILTIHYN
jgi:hypothetical protein